jgi:UDP:flavonoid glycosyltransferase YjiC (YdhE family)
MRVLFAVPPGHGLFLPVVPLAWAARVAGHDVLVATASGMVGAAGRAGLASCDVVADRDVWDELMRAVTARGEARADVSEVMRRAAAGGNPFGVFTLTMTEGTVAAGRRLGADLVVHTSDHPAGALAAQALDLPVLEVGNRVSWSMRDAGFAAGRDALVDDGTVREMRGTLGLAEGRPRTLARIDPRPPSMGGLHPEQEHPDPRDGAPWWPMRFVPYNGGGPVPGWVYDVPERPRVLVTLGTVVPSMSGVGPLGAVLEALGGLAVEVVLAAGDADLSELGELPPNVRVAGYLPLSSVLPGCALAVHHGGSGSTAAPLHYGVPQLVLPSFADNPMSAARVAERGVGLSLDPALADAGTVRALVRRLLEEPSFAEAAGQVRAEMAGQPGPDAVLRRVEAALRTAPAAR